MVQLVMVDSSRRNHRELPSVVGRRLLGLSLDNFLHLLNLTRVLIQKPSLLTLQLHLGVGNPRVELSLVDDGPCLRS